MKRSESIEEIQLVLDELQRLTGRSLKYDLISQANVLLTALQKSTNESLNSDEEKQLDDFAKNCVAQEVSFRKDRRKVAGDLFADAMKQMNSTPEQHVNIMPEPPKPTLVEQQVNVMPEPAKPASVAAQSVADIQKSLRSSAGVRSNLENASVKKLPEAQPPKEGVPVSVVHQTYDVINQVIINKNLINHVKKTGMFGGSKIKLGKDEYKVPAELSKIIILLQQSNLQRDRLDATRRAESDMQALVDVYALSKAWLEKKAHKRIEMPSAIFESNFKKGDARSRADDILDRLPPMSLPKEHRLHAELFRLLDPIVHSEGIVNIKDINQASIATFKKNNGSYVPDWLGQPAVKPEKPKPSTPQSGFTKSH